MEGLDKSDEFRSEIAATFLDFPPIVSCFFNEFVTDEYRIFNHLFANLANARGIGTNGGFLICFPGDFDLSDVEDGEEPVNGILFDRQDHLSFVDPYLASYEEFQSIVTLFVKWCRDRFPSRKKEVDKVLSTVLNDVIQRAKEEYLHNHEMIVSRKENKSTGFASQPKSQKNL